MRFVLLSCLIVAVLGSGLYFAKLTVDEQYRTLKQIELEIKSQTEHNYVLQAELLDLLLFGAFQNGVVGIHWAISQ